MPLWIVTTQRCYTHMKDPIVGLFTTRDAAIECFAQCVTDEKRFRCHVSDDEQTFKMQYIHDVDADTSETTSGGPGRQRVWWVVTRYEFGQVTDPCIMGVFDTEDLARAHADECSARWESKNREYTFSVHGCVTDPTDAGCYNTCPASYRIAFGGDRCLDGENSD